MISFSLLVISLFIPHPRGEAPSAFCAELGRIGGNDAPAPAQARAGDSTAVMAIVAGFKGALKSGDSSKALGYLHSELIVFESRQAENLAEYRSGHLAADINYLKSVTQTTTKETLNISGDLALYTSLYTSSGTSRGRAVNSSGTETMILARTPEGWRIRHIHW